MEEAGEAVEEHKVHVYLEYEEQFLALELCGLSDSPGLSSLGDISHMLGWRWRSCSWTGSE